MPLETTNSQKARLKIALQGAVQGVGFRPFIFRLAEELKLPGWVNNSPQGVFMEVEGSRSVLEHFLFRLEAEKPARSFIQSLETSWLDPVGYDKFEIRASETTGNKSALVLPDIATCPDCLRDIGDTNNRRYRYPFTNCTNCGPRFSIIEALPYDRANTSMRQFVMCPTCQAEYENPGDRRFHAQPNACPVCGPQLELWDAQGAILGTKDVALRAAVAAIQAGKIVAVKGLGGFHLLVDARNEKSIRRLRERKNRDEKPFALLFPTLAHAQAYCEISPLEARLLLSPAAPIVLLRKISPAMVSLPELVSPGNSNLGVMLPSNPLHHLLMAALDMPVIATSGNLIDEPICTDEREALQRLGGIAELFLIHNRPIIRHVDDSIARVMLDREMILRRARGYAPLPIRLTSQVPGSQPEVILATGAHLKNAIALAVGDNVFLSQHIGDLETVQAADAFLRSTIDLPKFYGASPSTVVADLHPDYLPTRFAQDILCQRHVGVQHHLAHILSCIAENEVALPALGVAWDGTGYGGDGMVWGGEFFLVTQKEVQRVAHLRPFRLPGAGKAVNEPRRVALGLLYELYGEAAFEMQHLPPLRAIPPVEMMTLRGMLQRRVHSPQTTSMGRLFDAVASLTNLRQTISFEGQAAMELEFLATGSKTELHYSFPLLDRQRPLTLDWAPLALSVLTDATDRLSLMEISTKFHNALAESVVAVAKKIGENRVVLSGGCFQNRYLTEQTVTRLRQEKFSPHWHQRVPANDGGIALGQVYAARNDLHLK